MFAKSYGAVTFGVDGRIVDVEVDVSYGFPAFDIVGLLDTAVKESRERVRTAIKNTGVKLKPARVTINLAPADIRKDSSGLDLPIAVGLLTAYGLIPTERIEHALFAAELSLEGELRSVRGVLSMTVGAKEHGFKEISLRRAMAVRHCSSTASACMHRKTCESCTIFSWARRNCFHWKRHLLRRVIQKRLRMTLPMCRGSFSPSVRWRSRRQAGTIF